MTRWNAILVLGLVAISTIVMIYEAKFPWVNADARSDPAVQWTSIGVLNQDITLKSDANAHLPKGETAVRRYDLKGQCESEYSQYSVIKLHCTSDQAAVMEAARQARLEQR